MSQQFRFTARNAAGVKERGDITADTTRHAFETLQERGLRPIQITKTNARKKQVSRIPEPLLAAFARELSITLEAGIPLAEAMSGIAETEEDEALRHAVESLASSLRAGMPLGQALNERSTQFGTLFSEMMLAAEMTGDLRSVTNDLAELLDRRAELRKNIRRAMAYPVIVLGFILAALSVITLFVVPRFAAIFEANGVELPLLTQILRTIGDTVLAHPITAGISTILAVGGSVVFLRSPRGARTIQQIAYRLPYFGDLLHNAATASFCRVFSVAIGAGLDVIQAIQIAASSCGDSNAEARLRAVTRRMRSGDDLRTALVGEQALPAPAIRMLCAGKEASEVGKSASLLRRHYDRETDGMTKNISTVIEPIMTVGMAMIVLIVALSVFLPMWGMIKAGT